MRAKCCCGQNVDIDKMLMGQNVDVPKESILYTIIVKEHSQSLTNLLEMSSAWNKSVLGADIAGGVCVGNHSYRGLAKPV